MTITPNTSDTLNGRQDYAQAFFDQCVKYLETDEFAEISILTEGEVTGTVVVFENGDAGAGTDISVFVNHLSETLASSATGGTPVAINFSVYFGQQDGGNIDVSFLWSVVDGEIQPAPITEDDIFEFDVFPGPVMDKLTLDFDSVVDGNRDHEDSEEAGDEGAIFSAGEDVTDAEIDEALNIAQSFINDYVLENAPSGVHLVAAQGSLGGASYIFGKQGTTLFVEDESNPEEISELEMFMAASTMTGNVNVIAVQSFLDADPASEGIDFSEVQQEVRVWLFKDNELQIVVAEDAKTYASYVTALHLSSDKITYLDGWGKATPTVETEVQSDNE